MDNEKLLNYIGGPLLLLAFSYVFFWVVVNWLLGCGEVFYTAGGGTIPGDCAPFWPWDLFGGNW